jgi:hypothetical protein
MATYVLAEFESGARMLAAARRVRDLRVGDLDGYGPYPIEGADEALGITRSKVPALVLASGLTGALFGYLMLYWCNAVDYPINVGGRPLHSYPAFIPITFELGVLFASMASFVGLLAFCGLPRPHHPVFDLARFRSASIDRFWLSVRTDDVGARSKIESVLADEKALDVAVLEDET